MIEAPQFGRDRAARSLDRVWQLPETLFPPNASDYDGLVGKSVWRE